MPTWFLYSLGAMISFSGMTLMVRKLASTIHGGVLAMLMLATVTFLYAVSLFIKKVPISLTREQIGFIILAALFSFVGNVCDVESIRMAPNPGYASAVKGGQMVIITIAAYFLFSGVTISIKGLVGIAFVLSGVIILATS